MPILKPRTDLVLSTICLISESLKVMLHETVSFANYLLILCDITSKC